jgi:hypothetical protein
MLEMVDAFPGADGGEKFSDRAPKFGCNPAHRSSAEPRKHVNRTPGFPTLILLRRACQDSEIACGTCCKRQMRDALPFCGTICPYLFPRIGVARKCSSVLLAVGETLLVGLTMVRNEVHHNHTAGASEHAVAAGCLGKGWQKLRPQVALSVGRAWWFCVGLKRANTSALEATAVLTDF